jgi:hypothetical protein
MTIDEIVVAMLANETEDGTWIDTTMARQIIAALKAGQMMYKDFDDNEVGYTPGQAAWDEATKETK